MKLYGSKTSPYVRKVRVQALEGGYWDKLEFVELSTTPIDPAAAIANPIKKVPTLELDDGSILYDSPVVCEYLDATIGGGAFPASGDARWMALGLQALGDGLLDAALLARYETSLRPAEFLWSDWERAQMSKVDGALVELDSQASIFGERVDIGTITAACALGYLDFRYADKDWRGAYPSAASWYAAFSARPSMMETVPPA